MSFLAANWDLLRSAFLTTLSLALLAGLVAAVIGVLLTAARVSPVGSLRVFATFYVETFRNTPLTVVFFFLIFGLPQIDASFPTNYTAAVAALGLYTAAFVSEALRSGINSVPPGQAEAARALGLDFRQSLSTIVLPQAFRTVIPPLGSVWIALVKNTSIAAGFAVSELVASLQRLANSSADQLALVFLSVIVGYLLITLTSAFGFRLLERKLAIVR